MSDRGTLSMPLSPAYCLAKSRRYSGGRYTCMLPKDHGGSHRCDTIQWDASGDVRKVKP